MSNLPRLLKISIAGSLLLLGLLALCGEASGAAAVFAFVTLFSALSLQQYLADDSVDVSGKGTASHTHSPESPSSEKQKGHPERSQRSQLLVNLDSDIRTPLQNIFSIADEIMVGDLSWTQRKNVSRLRDQAETLNEVVNIALDFAKIDSGRLRLQPVAFSLRESLRELLAPLSQLARHQERHVRHLVQTRVPDNLSGDVERLRNVLLTLLDRIGVQTTMKDVELRVAAESRSEDQATIRFTISGGNTHAVADTVATFAADGALDNVSAERKSTTDLALALAVQMIRLLGGQLHVLRDDHQPPALSFTAVFTVVAGLSSSGPERTMLGLIPDLPVLVVHSANPERERLESLLIAWQTEPTSVSSGDEMWAALEESRRLGTTPGLLIVDAELLGQDADELCRDLQQNPLYSPIPRILLTSNSTPGQPPRINVAACVPGPVEPSMLARAIVSSVLGGGRFKQMRKGLDAAEVYVRSLIPLPVTEPIGIDWRYVPAADLAGDALGFQWIDEDHCALYVLDVCGHGLDAGLLCVSVLNVLKSMTLPDTDFRQPGQVLTQLNRAFPMESHGDRCFTVWYGVYQRSTNKLRWSAGGHPPALLLSPEAENPLQLTSCGPMLGMISDFEFTDEDCTVRPGDRLLIYSDGVFELETPDGKFGTFEDFVDFCKADASSPTLLDDLWNRARLVNGDDTLDDDFTVLDVRL